MLKRLSAIAATITGSSKNLGDTGGWQEKSTLDGMKYYYNTETNEITWEKPLRLRTVTEADREAGEWTWIPDVSPNGNVWQPARKIDTLPDGSFKYENQEGKAFIIPADGKFRDANGTVHQVEFWPLTLSSLKMEEDDLIMLQDINKGLIMHTLRKRYLDNELYTWVGASHTVLISVNPYKMLNIYGEDKITKHRNRSPNRELPPHVFDIANDSYDSMLFDNINQSVLISGESGAGKTEATKQCLKFIASVAGSENNVETKILQANPVLEAFGNAKTIRNNNSSRFGKWIEVYFAPGKRNITSARIINYLLEKSRLVHQQGGERNFHIFYQMAADPSTNEKFQIGADLKTHRFLCNGIVGKIQGIDDKGDFDAMITAMKDLGFSQEEIDGVLRVAAFVLHLGNCTFVDKAMGNNVKGSSLESDSALELAAKFLNVKVEELRKVLLSRSITVRSETSVIPLDPAAARAGCDSLAKGVYGRLFDWLVVRINDALKGAEGSFVGILDIFGFEIFENNSFEQLCINYTNEKLQQLFNKTTFKEEEALYEREKIQFTHIEFIDNQVVLDLIEAKPSGILPLLDDECLVPEGSDAKFMLKIEQAHASNSKFQTDTKRKLSNSLAFEIFHYAGVVCYDASAFSDKNKDTFFDDCYQLVGQSTDPLPKNICPKLDSRLQTKSLSVVFRGQLGALMEKLNKTRTRYIRCIKPNDKMSPDLFNTRLSLEQLTYSGVFEAVQIRRKGYPFRWLYQAFATRYRCINPNHKYKTKVTDEASAKELCKEILEASPQDFKDVQFGETMVLYRSKEHRMLKLLRNLALETIIPRLQKYMRGLLPREMKRRLLRVEKNIRDAIEKKNDYAALKTALDTSETVIGTLRTLFPGYQPRNIPEGQAYLAELQKWMDMQKELEAFLTKDPNTNYSAFTECLSRGEALRHIPQSDLQIELMNKSYQTLKNCEVGKIDSESQDIVNGSKKLVKRDKLQQLSSGASKYGFSSPSMSTVNEMLAEFVRIDSEASSALQAKSRERMLKVIQDADVFDYKAPCHDDMMKILEKFDSIDKICDAALNSMNREELKNADKVASEINFTSAKVERVRWAIPEFDRVEAEAANAVAENNATRILKVTADALVIKYTSEAVAAAAALAKDYQALDNSIQSACDTLDGMQLRKGMARAKEVKLTSATVLKGEELLKMPEKQFVLEELKIAEAQNDQARIIHRKIRLLQIELDENGSAYSNFQTFSDLRTPDEYASSKMFGKAKLRDNFYKADTSTIPTSLTKSVDAVFKKQAVAMNKSLVAYSYGGKDAEALTFLNVCYGSGASEQLKIEMFAQLIKNCTENSTPNAERAWNLLGLSCMFIPLPEKIEKFVMMFVKKKAPEGGAKFLSAINECKYGRGRLPSDIPSAVVAFNKLGETGSRFSIHEGSNTGPSLL